MVCRLPIIIDTGYYGAQFWGFQPRDQINALKNLWNDFDKIITEINSTEKYQREKFST